MVLRRRLSVIQPQGVPTESANISMRQLLANKANALKSTGPRTEGGKARSSRNSLKHGLTAQQIVIPGEDHENYSRFEESFLEDLKPQDACQFEIVVRLAATFWRLRRIPRLEAALLAWREYVMLHDDQDSPSGLLAQNFALPGGKQSAREELLDKHTALRWTSRDPYALKVLGRLIENTIEDGVLIKLSSYESRLLRQSHELLSQFFTLKKMCGTEKQE
jgi:hypothetical protein